MSKKVFHWLFTAIALFGLLLPTMPSLAASLLVSQNEKKDKDKKKKESAAEQQPSKQDRKYEEIREFSVKLYEKDPSFRSEVEQAYRRRQRQENEYAWSVNTRNNFDEQVMHTGDKLKTEDTLYDNPLVQDYINRLGQSLVPKDSKKRYAFRVTLNPIPEARSLSTGTIYISTGMISQADNEAQLAYALGHEIAHVEKNHWHHDVVFERGIHRYNKSQADKREAWGTLMQIGLGVAMNSSNNPSDWMALQNFQNFLSQNALPSMFKMISSDAVVSWHRTQEDEADQHALKFLLERSYDPREAPKFLIALQRTSERDSRNVLGFIADTDRVTERMQQVQQVISGFGTFPNRLSVGATNLNFQEQPAGSVTLAIPEAPGKPLGTSADATNRATAATTKVIAGTMAAEIAAKLKSGELIGSSAEFESVMAELKRDNGLRAFYYDMFHVALKDLEESLRIRSNDPYTHLYYGKVLKLTARTPAEKGKALYEFRKAIDLDQRGVLSEPHLHLALAMIEEKNATQMPEIVRSLKRYVEAYQQEHSGILPPNMDVIYAYLQEADDLKWAARPVTNISTKNLEPINIALDKTLIPAPASNPVSNPSAAGTEKSPITPAAMPPSPAPSIKPAPRPARKP